MALSKWFPFPKDKVPETVDEKEWKASYGPYGARGTTMNIDVKFAGIEKMMSVALANQVSYQAKHFESGILGLNIASTTKSWPGSKGHYDPL